MKLKSTMFALLALAVTACSGGDDYRNALPADASLVVAADLPSLVGKSGLSGEKGRALLQDFSAMLKSELKGYETLVDEIMMNPSESGLDLTSTAYLFAGPHATRAGLLFRVNDEEKVERLLNVMAEKDLCPAPQDGSGCRYVAMGSGIVAYTGTALLVLAKDSGDASVLLHPASILLRNGKDDGFAATDAFGKMADKTNDVTMYFNMDILPANAAGMKMGWPADVNMSDIEQLATLDFEEGRAVLDAVSLTDTSVWKKLYGERMYTYRPLKGSFLDLLPAEMLFCCMMNVSGEEMYAQLAANAMTRNRLNNPLIPVSMERILKAVNGDAVLAMPSFNPMGFVLYADVDDKAFMQEFENLRPLAAMSNGRLKVSSPDADTYDISFAVMNIPVALRIGVKDNRLCVTNNPELFHAGEPAHTYRSSEPAENVRDKAMHMSMNIAACSAALASAGKEIPLLGELDYFTMDSSDGLSVHMELVASDRETNILETLLSLKQNAGAWSR